MLATYLSADLGHQTGRQQPLGNGSFEVPQRGVGAIEMYRVVVTRDAGEVFYVRLRETPG